jgi:uncharacterized protein
VRRSLKLLAISTAAAVSLLAATDAGAFEAHGSVEQVYVTGAAPGAKLKLVRKGKTVTKDNVNELGGLVFRGVKPGKGYTVKGGGSTSKPLKVLTDKAAPPDPSIYNQTIPSSGYGYLTTRDGTELAYTVHPPTDISSILPGDIPSISTPGQSPTLIEYSGYGTADPSGPESGISVIANLLGFTVVDVNMRGTGCSGGSFDFFEPLQGLDGYDVIETIARQPWVANGKVGMMGISYGGISQLFTAQYQPPSLAAITPLSVLDQTQTTLYPGGVLNTGFAVEWAKDRVHDALPAGPDSGQPWAYEQIQNGDAECAKNQELHPDAVNLLQKIKANNHYVKSVADPLSPITFVDKINVPTFMACQWQDEQTGGHCPTLAAHMSGTKKKWFTFTNGAHIDSLDPETFNRWLDFLYLYVAKQSPLVPGVIAHAGAPVIYQEAMGITGVSLPPDPIQTQPTYESALSAFEAQKSVRLLFDNGAGASPGVPQPGYERSYDSFPIPGTTGRSWYLGPNGSMADSRTGGKHADGFRWDASALPPTNFTGNTGGGAGGLWTDKPDYNWVQHPQGTAVSYVSSPLESDVTVAGSGYVKVWVRSSRKSVDLQATVSEVRPDNKETFVQGGWVRGNERKLDKAKSTPLEPVLSLRKKDVEAMPKDAFVPVTIPLYYQGHGYRKGSRLRVTISAPGGDQPVWAFAKTKGPAKVAIAYGKKHPSKLTLPVIPDAGIPTALPPCPGLRGEPCRDYQPLENASAKP